MTHNTTIYEGKYATGTNKPDPFQFKYEARRVLEKLNNAVAVIGKPSAA